MIDDYPDTLALLTIMRSAPYTVPWGNMRDAMYQAGWVPHSCHDGLYEAWPYTTYESKFLARRQVPTDVTIELAAFGSGGTWDITATICVEPGGVGKTMDIWMAQVLDHHGPVNHDRNEVQDGNQGVEIFLAADECTTVTERFVLNDSSLASPTNVKFFVWAQDTNWVFDPQYFYNGGSYLSAYVAEIYQGAKALPPFAGIFTDGFENGDMLRWTGSAP